MPRPPFTPMGDDLNESPPDTKTSVRVTFRIERSVMDAAKRAFRKEQPTRKPAWWLTRWCEMGALADGVVLYDVDHTGPAEVLVGPMWTPCVVLARGPEHVTVGIGGEVRTVAPELVRRVEG